MYSNLGTIMTISQDRVKPSPHPDSWKLNEIFATGIVIGTYQALVTVFFYWIVIETTFFEVWNREMLLLDLVYWDSMWTQHQETYLLGLLFPLLINYLLLQDTFGLKSISDNSEEVSSAVYLQVSIISQALIFVTRSQGWSFLERPGTLLMIAFVVAQLVRLKKKHVLFYNPFTHLTSRNGSKRIRFQTIFTYMHQAWL